VGLAVGVAAGISACSIIPAWLGVLVPPGMVVAFLVGLEVAYVLLVGSALVGALVLGVLLFRARCQKKGRTRLARWLLLCVSCLMMFLGAEVAAAVWLSWTHRVPALPRAAADLPHPSRYADRSDHSEVRLAVLGESSAVGFPYQDWLSVGQIVAWQLGKAIPERTFRLELVAVPGHTLEQQHKKLVDLGSRPDVLIIYCGHNEFAAPTPAGREVDHYLDTRSASTFLTIGGFAARLSPLCRMIQETTDQYRVHRAPARDRRRPLVDVPSYTSAEYAQRLANFQRRLEAIVSHCEQIKALPILVIPPGNDGDFEPNRSFLSPTTPRADREAFAEAFQSARQLETRDPDRSIKQYRELLAHQPGFAEAHFRLARLLEQRGCWDEAYQHYVSARDLDGHPVRCLTAFQEAYREVAARHHCILIDGQALFRKAGVHGLLDDHLFNDAMHPSLRGHIALAQGILKALHARRAFGWPAGSTMPVIDPAGCAAHFGLNAEAWKIVCERGVMFYVGMANLRYDPTERRAKQAAFGKASQKITAGAAPESVGLPNIGVP
jgi:hypothetical protein